MCVCCTFADKHTKNKNNYCEKSLVLVYSFQSYSYILLYASIKENIKYNS